MGAHVADREDELVSERTEDVAEPTAPAAAAPPRRRALLEGLPWALFVAALAVAIVFAVLWQGAQASDRRRADVASAAGRFLAALTNFTGQTIDADAARIRSFAAGDFARQVDAFFDQQARDALRSAGARSVGRVRSIFVESIAGDSATVFGVVDESVTNQANPVARTEVLRIEIDTIRTTGGWKVERVNILQSPTEGPFGPSP